VRAVSLTYNIAFQLTASYSIVNKHKIKVEGHMVQKIVDCGNTGDERTQPITLLSSLTQSVMTVSK